ncbi:putative pyrroloquinoline-quinone binding quinoprotein [Krasilnikovia cinnamomea]|uniref:Putative pyrroloquinoline-quinone binding quinoprotein n=1 Tax=Krasilnikovia cinnamomea TaxID=349313 RepID=A0A4Q7ZGU9_9ACTN|nr:putative pyrroloquinoline-quinone binding quinoprotein [Krasilnikovia cinnamomea]
MALIELSDDPSAPPAATRPSVRRHRRLGLALAAVLALALAGAVPAAAVYWRHAGVVPLPAAADFQVVGGRLYTLDVADGRRITSAWTMRPLRRLWRAATTADDAPGGALQGGGSVQAVGGHVLLRAGQATTVLDARTGAVRWTSPVPVLPLTDDIGLVQAERFRPGTEYDESSGAPGALYFSSSGQPHTEPPEVTELRGVDLTTGQPRWSARFPGSIYPARARGRVAGVLVLASGRLSLRAAESGAVLREQSLARIPGAQSWGDVVGDLLLVRQAAADDGTVVTAYAMDTLAPRWRRTEPAAAGNSATCTGLACEKGRSHLVVLDPGTGRPRWRTTGDVDLQTGAGYALEVQSGRSRPLRALDPASGVPVVDLSAWQTFATGPSAAPLVLARREAGRGTAFGVLLPGRRAIQRLGQSRAAVTDCSADSRFVACRAAAGVEVWAYSAG